MSESQYVKRWKSWISRKKVFSPDELNELETYLLDKMESLQGKNQLSEKESFQQALDAMGESGLLNEEYTKIRKSPFDKVKWWALIQTVVSVLLVVFIVGSYYRQNRSDSSYPDDSIFVDCGWAVIPDDFSLCDLFVFDDKLYFLDSYSENFILIDLEKSIENGKSDYHFSFKGTLLPETNLKLPTSLCQDEDTSVYILETGDNRIQQNSLIKVMYIYGELSQPLHIMKITKEKEYEEYDDIHLKIPEIKKKKIPKQIRIWGKYLLISFYDYNNGESNDNNFWVLSSTILLINKNSLNKPSLDYRVLTLPSNLIDFNIYENKLWLLYADRIEWFVLKENSEPIKEGTIKLHKNVSNNTELLQHQNYQDFILFDHHNHEIQFINKETHQTKIHKATGITNLYVFNEKEISGIFSFVEQSGMFENRKPSMQMLYLLKPSGS